jgi:hypothetical protein
MAAISEFYASPGLRLGLLLEDHPEATYDFQLVTGADIGVPDKFGGDKQFCLATIRFPIGRSDVTAWKPVPASGTADDWNILCTKTLGRALKRAGYPDDLKDLKALVLWRQRDAEIAAIRGGAELSLPSANAIAALPAADPMQAALDEAGVTSDEAIGGDEDADVIDASPNEIISDETLNEITELMGGLDKTEEKVFVAFLKKLGISNLNFATADDAEAILGWFDA